MDNLGAHEVAGVCPAIEAAGAELRYLPPYSPDLNPVELAFAKLKALPRTAASRTVEALWQAIGRLLDAFTPPNAPLPCPCWLCSIQPGTALDPVTARQGRPDWREGGCPSR
jgi:hypothetical protein